MNERIKKLLELIKQNPELPIIPMVSIDGVQDDGGFWVGKWGMCEVNEYCYIGDKFYTRDEQDYIEEVIADEIYDASLKYPSEEEIQERLNEIEWIKAIIVDIVI